MNDRFLSLLGISERAGQLCSGHDAVKQTVNTGKAKLIIFTSDASERLRDEFLRKTEDTDIKIINTGYTMEQIHFATGNRAAVLCVTDIGFAKRLTELFNEKHKEV